MEETKTTEYKTLNHLSIPQLAAEVLPGHDVDVVRGFPGILIAGYQYSIAA
jgi:hypothetical protein